MRLFHLCFFFFKQKTAYEMRISDWSSDVCSSDLRRCERRKRGAESAAIGRSRGGLTTKLHAAVDAIGLPIRIHPTPGQYGDRPQAEALLAGLKRVGHVIDDAAYDADPLRAFIAADHGANAPLKANPRKSEERMVGEESVSQCKYTGAP